MPKCVKCSEFFHPDYCVEALPDDPKDTGKVCVFCKIKKSRVTIEDDQGNYFSTVSKKTAIESYKKYIYELKNSRKIEHLLKTGDQSKIIY